MQISRLFIWLIFLAIASALPAQAQNAAPAPAAALPVDPAAAPAPAAADDGAPKEDEAVEAPQRERDLIAIYADTRKQYDEKTAITKTKDLRIALQNHVITFMEGGQDFQDWVGIVKSRGTTPEGDAWIAIQVGDGGLAVATWQSRFFDRQLGTLFKSYSPLFAPAQHLKIGQRVVFSGRIIESVNTTDDEMVARPQLIARFTSLRAAAQ